MKEYPKTYESVFNDDSLVNNKCKLEEVSTFENVPNISEYGNLIRKTFHSFEMGMFSELVKLYWLFRRFCYFGYHRKNNRGNGIEIDRAFGVFMRYYVGIESRFIFASNGAMGKIASYFNDFFPDLDISNPFETEFKYPFKYMMLEHLVVVYRMPERMDILKKCEADKMSYTEFLDYVLNYIYSYNDEHGYTYELILSHVYQPYVKKMTK